VLEYCQRYAPHRVLGEKERERQLEEEQAQLAAQLIEIQTGRLELEEALAVPSEDQQTPCMSIRHNELYSLCNHLSFAAGPSAPTRSRTFGTVQEMRRADQPQRSQSQRETTQVWLVWGNTGQCAD
jgi:uncharacterized protein YunC (DUF1805 family)